MKLWNYVSSFVARAAVATKREEGQTMVEYGLIIAGIALVVVLAFTALSGDLTNLFKNTIASNL